MGGGQEDLSEPENFICLFSEQENFFRRPFGPDFFFLNLPQLFSLNRGGGGGGGLDIQLPHHLPGFFSFPEMLPFYNAKSHFPSIMYFWSE